MVFGQRPVDETESIVEAPLLHGEATWTEFISTY
jgi:hypothetical protein